MPVAIDTSILVAAETAADFAKLLPNSEEGPYYIPVLAAVEFPVETRPPVRADLRQRAARLYQSCFRGSESGPGKGLMNLKVIRTESECAAVLVRIEKLMRARPRSFVRA
jgi:hypothetical protein